VGSLRQAILAANSAPPPPGQTDNIIFDIGVDPFVITLTVPLPAITVPVFIDGTTQPGYYNQAALNPTAPPPEIEINGRVNGVSLVGDGLTLGSAPVAARSRGWDLWIHLQHSDRCQRCRHPYPHRLKRRHSRCRLARPEFWRSRHGQRNRTAHLEQREQHDRTREHHGDRPSRQQFLEPHSCQRPERDLRQFRQCIEISGNPSSGPSQNLIQNDFVAPTPPHNARGQRRQRHRDRQFEPEYRRWDHHWYSCPCLRQFG